VPKLSAPKPLAFSPVKRTKESRNMATPAHTPITAVQRRSVVAIRESAAAGAARQAKLKASIDRTADILDRLEARAKAFAAEAKRIGKLKAATEARIERIETDVLKRMAAAQQKKWTGLSRTLTARPNALSLIVDDAAQIPPAYLRTVPSYTEPDKLSIKAALAADEDLIIAGVHLAQSTSLLRG
jgi:hypothetical protein